MIAVIVLAAYVANVWALTLSVMSLIGLALTFKPNHAVRKLRLAADRVHQELWPFAPPGLLIILGDAVDRHDYIKVFITLIAAYAWWSSRNEPDDDGPWKRRGRRIKNAVRRAGAKLVVVPASNPS